MPYSVGQAYPPKPSPGRLPARAPSPNYFGLVVEAASDPRDSSTLPREQWSPPSSSVKSFSTALPKQVPLDANPEFEAFKRQADLNRGKGFSLPTSHTVEAPQQPQHGRPKASRWNTHSSVTNKSGYSSIKVRPLSRMDVEQDSPHDSAYVSGDSKRNSESSIWPAPVIVTTHDGASPSQSVEGLEPRTTLSKSEDRDPRLSVMENRIDPPSPRPHVGLRPETVPPTMQDGTPTMMFPGQLRNMLESDRLRILLLDVRSAQNFAQAHIEGALNLCIPTTLLKRANFNLQKLQQTFQRSGDQEVFSRWRDADHLVVYDAFSSERMEATTAMNMIKKFTNEGYTGTTSILRGGFRFFSEEYPDLIQRPARDSPTSPGANPKGGLAPVIGGVALPKSGTSPNPFFSNIRQNIDLADGVGQMDIARPTGLESPLLPRWLRAAVEADNRGKRVSDKFLTIEKDEQSRMKQAYSLFGGQDTASCMSSEHVRLCGIEQGGKNRYKDILPFEHARVKLVGQPDSGSDYVNASHVKASSSNKRYIATQGPLPATFNDFWSVIWDQDVRVIVMLTAESEGGQLKCHAYWQSRDYGPIKLKLLSEKKVSLEVDKHRSDSTATMSSSSSGDTGRRRANTVTAVESSTQTPQPLPIYGETPYVIIRKFALSHAAHPFAPIREITHLHYPSWPDFGAPAQPSHLLALVELANVMQRASLPLETSAMSKKAETLPITWYDEPEADAMARPMLVHCSAGCGRTGTFCTVDSVLDMLKRQRMAKISKASRARTSRQPDADGDVAMEEDISPLSTQRQMSFSGAVPSSSSLRSNTEAGVARQVGLVMTGTRQLDMSWLEDETVDLVQKTVEEFRQQRLSMVQSLRQFVLCYEAVLEWIWRINEKSIQSATVRGGRARSGSLYVRREG